MFSVPPHKLRDRNTSDALLVQSRLSAVVAYSHNLLTTGHSARSDSGHSEGSESADKAAPNPLNSSALSHLFHTSGPMWREGSFCDDFLERQYHTSVEVCDEDGGGPGEPQIKCFWNPQNAHAATCDIENAMMRPQKLWKAMDNVQGTFPQSGSVRLLQSNDFSCEKSTIQK